MARRAAKPSTKSAHPTSLARCAAAATPGKDRRRKTPSASTTPTAAANFREETMTRRSVMISSTARDLPTHRDEARLACLRSGFDPREMMENLPALNKDAVEALLRMV